MRNIFLLLFFVLFSAHAEEYSVFEQNGRYGLKTESGEVTVPAVHDQLGWSDGSVEVIDGVIGFKRGNLWGLLTARNKVLTENKFYSILKESDQFIKASIKGRFSNQLFYGLLDTTGETIVSFNYAGLKIKGDLVEVSQFNQFQSKVGILSLENQIIVPLNYERINLLEGWTLGKHFDQTYDLYLENQLIGQKLDSVRIVSQGVVAFRNGFAGYYDRNGVLKWDFTFKNFVDSENHLMPTSFPKWETVDPNGEVFFTYCDSITRENNLWINHMNGAQHIGFDAITPIDLDYELLEVVGDQFIARHSKTGYWAVLSASGEILIEDQDRIQVSDKFYLSEKDKKWNLFNRFGSKINRFALQQVYHGVEDHFIAKRNNYWGILDIQGEPYVPFKYDSIFLSTPGFYAIKFLNNWGVTDKHGNWRIAPRFDEILNFGEIVVARKGSGLSYYKETTLLYKTTFEIAAQLDNHYLIEDELGKFGLLDEHGQVEVYPSYDRIQKIDSFLVLEKDSVVTLENLERHEIIKESDQIEEVGQIGDRLIAVKKNGRWGFLDFEGRLRIANRYDEVGMFSEGFAPVKLRNKWGIIDETERLRVQPYYDFISAFREGVAIVRINKKYGLINVDGKEIVKVEWEEITRSPIGNYRVKRTTNAVGLTDSKGKFILSPDFESVKDLNKQIVIQQNGRMGTVDYNARPLRKTIYSNIEIRGDYILFMH